MPAGWKRVPRGRAAPSRRPSDLRAVASAADPGAVWTSCERGVDAERAASTATFVSRTYVHLHVV
eukprot:7384852-Prymnesium_polylepis.1